MERADAKGWGYTLENIGANVIRYGLVIVLLWVGALKFTAYEAEGIQGLVANSPLMSWMPGQFLAKDLFFLGASIWTAGEALRTAGWRNNRINSV